MSKFNFKNEAIVSLDHSYLTGALYLTTPEGNFASEGEARAVNVIYEDAQTNNVVWQPDVLWEAKNIADRLGITHVVDIGCGGGHKLVHYFQEGNYDVVGLDYHGSLSLSRTSYPEWQWVECDLTSYDDLSRVSAELSTEQPVVMILSDVIEHLTDPRPLVAWMRSQLIKRKGSRLIVSTPDRLRLDYENVNSKPENKAHVREWSLLELEQFFISSGLEIVRSGHTRANQFDPVNATIFIELSCSIGFYEQFLIDFGLLHSTRLPQHLLLTTEYSGFHSTGGIGTFVREQRDSYGHDISLCLFGGAGLSDTKRLLEERLISPMMLFRESDIRDLPLEDKFLKAVQQLIFYFPDIETVQYADYQGIGCRIAQGKKSGLLPQTLRVIAHCHGMTHYLENAHESWFGLTHSGVAEKEKISVEGADLVVFPTTFLHDLYAQAGIVVHEENTVRLRYPLNSKVPTIRPSTCVDTLIFYGKRSRMKGYDLFLDCLVGEDVEQWKALGITTICLIGPRIDANQEHESMLSKLRDYYHVEEFNNVGRLQAIEVLQDRAHRAICLMPYLADNHPYALLDVAFSTVVPLMVKSGGVPEMFAGQFLDICLAEPNSVNLRTRLNHLLEISPEQFNDLRADFVSTMAHMQRQINEKVKAFPASFPAKTTISHSEGTATIIVPVFNTPLDYIEDLIFGLNNQSVKPSEVIFVDDASETAYASELQSVVRDNLRLPYRIIRHNENKGLAGARNTGLNSVTTAFTINIDSDDVPLNDFVRDIVFTLKSNPECCAAVPYLRAFEDGADFNTERFGGYVYRPVGDGVIASQLDNQLGHANAGFRTATMLEFGGWDESSKAMWEDWALYLKLTAAGQKIAIIPKDGCLYRVRPLSMLRTYKVWPAMRRLADNMVGLPKYENFRLQAMLRSYRDSARHEAELVEQVHSLQQELNRGGVRVALSVANRVARYPAFFRAARICGRIAWQLLRGASRLARRIRG